MVYGQIDKQVSQFHLAAWVEHIQGLSEETLVTAGVHTYLFTEIQIFGSEYLYN